MVEIISNGSKFAGEQPDSIETLKKVLREHPVRLEFGLSGFQQCVDRAKGIYQFHGNFETISHVFQIQTDERPLQDQLHKLIEDNLARQQREKGFEEKGTEARQTLYRIADKAGHAANDGGTRKLAGLKKALREIRDMAIA